MSKITIVIPVYNEEGNIVAATEKLRHVFKSHPGADYETIFVDDGSTDASLLIAMNLSADNSNVFYLSLSRNL